MVKWVLLGTLTGVLSGSASAFFLWALDRVTGIREANPWLLFLLPMGGLIVGWLYDRFGQLVSRGNKLILDQLHDGQERVPLRMAPMVLFGTLITHLLGGSAGREGTAVQMGGSLADTAARWLRLKADDRRLLLMSGVSGGFASVFGTPLAGTVFSIEFLRTGAMRYNGLVPCLVAALVGDEVATLWGSRHTHYAIGALPGRSAALFGKVAVAGVAFGLAALLFVALVRAVKGLFAAIMPTQVFRPAMGAVLLIVLVLLVGGHPYIGLGIPVIQAAFVGPVDPLAFVWKTLFTAVTLGAGFVGGEVTPLFFVGATLGNWLARLLVLPGALLPGVGFVAVFAGAAKTPVTAIIMGMELFGHEALPYVGLAAVLAYLCSGRQGIYASQLDARSPRG